MRISNFRPSPEGSQNFVLAKFDIEDIEMVWEGALKTGIVFRDWELKSGKNNNYYVQSKWAGYDLSDPAKKVSHYVVEMPSDFRKLFSAKVLELLKPYHEKIMQAQRGADSSFVGYQDLGF